MSVKFKNWFRENKTIVSKLYDAFSKEFCEYFETNGHPITNRLSFHNFAYMIYKKS